MLKYIGKRLLTMIPVMLGISLLIFFIMDLAPGNAAISILGDAANEESIAQLEEEMGLNDPFFTRFFRYIGGVLQGDFGRSYKTGESVVSEIAVRYPVTLKLAVFGILLSLVIGIPIGILSAVKQYSVLDYTSMLLTLLMTSMPGFWLGMLLLLLFSLKLGWFPVTGAEGLISFVLPTVTVAARSMANIARMTRATMLEVLSQDYVRTARAKGNPERFVIFRHSLKNALIPVVTVAGTNFGALMGGAVLIESVFAMPGLGTLLVDGIRSQNTPVVMACTLLIALSFSLINLMVDILYTWLDPRLKSQLK